MPNIPRIIRDGPVPYLDTPCPMCGAKLILKESMYGKFFGCEKWGYTGCSGSVGCHPNSTIPLGYPATPKVKKLRIDAHTAFDRLWRGPDKKMARSVAYVWLREKLGMSESEAHIGMFDGDQCKKLIDLIKAELGKEKE